MAVLFAGGELSSFTKFNAIEVATTGTFATPARCGVHVKKGGYIRTDTLGGVSEVWCHADINIANVTAGLQPINITNATGVSQFGIYSDGSVKVGTTIIGTIPLFNSRGRFTLDIYLRGGTTGLVEIYADSQVMFSAGGNFAIAGMQSLILSPTGNMSDDNTNTIYSQVIVATEITIGSKLATLVLEQVGSNNQWTGTSSDATADVGEMALNTDTFIFAPNAGMIESWVVSDLPARYTNVRAVVVSALAKYSASGPKNLDAVTVINGGSFYNSMTTLGPGYTPSQAIFHTNPTTNAAWTVAEVNAAEFGIRSKG